jgi:hypothetical protein
MKKGRKKDHVWKFIKYKGDMAIYAQCRCGFSYECYKQNGLTFIPDPYRLYPYCPVCGSRKKRYNPEVVKVDKFRWSS